MGTSQTRYTAEFNAEAAKQAGERGYPVPEVAQSLDISARSLYQWLRAHREADIHMRYAFIRAQKRRHAVHTPCRMMRVHRSGYQAWLACPHSRRRREGEVLGASGASKPFKPLEGIQP